MTNLLPLSLAAAAILIAPSVAADPPPPGPPSGPLPTLPSSSPAPSPPSGPAPSPSSVPSSAPVPVPAPGPAALPTSATPAPAYPPPPPPYAPPGYYPPNEPPRPQQTPADAHAHAGFFLRMAVGVGRMTDVTTVEGGTFAGSVDAAGGALSLELDIGGAISRGFILAGSYTGTFLDNPNLQNDTRRLRPLRESQLSLLALMADVYPIPSGGFHTGGALGLASLRIRNDSDPTTTSHDESGLGLSAHLGYAWWVSNYWGLGALARATYARTKGDYGGGTATDKMTAFSISFSATYN